MYSLGLTYYGNGDVNTAADVNGNWTYGYDAFNRLATAQTPPSNPTLAYSYSYDRFGNRWNQAVTTGTGSPVSLAINGNNRISTAGYQYDAAGNLLMDNLNCYSYDAENRLSSVAPETSPGSDVCGATTMSYLYDPDGRRVAKVQNGAVVKQFYYNAAGQEIAETNASGALQRAEIFAGGRHLATWSNNATYFNHADWLGTERARSNSSGLQCETITSLPFGDGEAPTGNCSSPEPSPNHFTGLERDTESGLDHTKARQYPSNLGRWLTPDPGGRNVVTITDPQTWNMYAYNRNNPTSLTDPTGLYNTSCNSKDISKCSVDIQNFEKNRQKDLKSLDNRVRAAAGAYGAFNDGNKVNLKFDAGLNHGSAVQDKDARGRPKDTVTVTLPGGMGTDARGYGLVADEGSHVNDFNNTMRGYTSPTLRQTEVRAYQTQAAAVLDYGVGSAMGYTTISSPDSPARLVLLQPTDAYADAANARSITEWLLQEPLYSNQNLDAPAYVKP